MATTENSNEVGDSVANSKDLADIVSEMRTYFQMQKRNGNPEHRTWHQVLSDWADRIEASARHQFWKIQSLCQAEIDSAISDHISSIFMLKVVRDISENQLSKLSQTGGKGKFNGSK